MLVDGFPSASGLVSPQDLRRDLAALVVRDTAGNPRLGIVPRSPAAVVSVRSDMKVDVAAFEAIVGRPGQGPILLANDGTTQVTIPPAPGANSRYDVVWVKQDDSVSPNADADNLPVFGVTSGGASPTPSKATVLAAIPTGALALAALLVPSGVAATNAGGVSLSQEHLYTAASGGVVYLRNTTERDAFAAGDGQLGFLLSTGSLIENLAGATVPGWFHVGGRPVLDALTFAGIYSSSGSSPTRVATQAGRAALEGIVVSTSATFVSGTTYTLGTIPAALAPSAPQVFTCSANATAVAAVQVDASGNVTMVLNSGFTGALALSLAGSWRLKGL